MIAKEDFENMNTEEASLEYSINSSTTVESTFDKVEIENMKTEESVECSTMQITLPDDTEVKEEIEDTDPLESVEDTAVSLPAPEVTDVKEHVVETSDPLLIHSGNPFLSFHLYLNISSIKIFFLVSALVF